jgi:hypothetical protein
MFNRSLKLVFTGLVSSVTLLSSLTIGSQAFASTYSDSQKPQTSSNYRDKHDNRHDNRHGNYDRHDNRHGNYDRHDNRHSNYDRHDNRHSNYDRHDNRHSNKH